MDLYFVKLPRIIVSSYISSVLSKYFVRSSEGLSAAMFTIAVSANICSGVSILLRCNDMETFLSRLPWLLNALGTVGLDLFIIYLALAYRAPSKKFRNQAGMKEKQEPLLLC